jgi:hypothetical protein
LSLESYQTETIKARRENGAIDSQLGSGSFSPCFPGVIHFPSPLRVIWLDISAYKSDKMDEWLFLFPELAECNPTSLLQTAVLCADRSSEWRCEMFNRSEMQLPAPCLDSYIRLSFFIKRKLMGIAPAPSPPSSCLPYLLCRMGQTGNSYRPEQHCIYSSAHKMS